MPGSEPANITKAESDTAPINVMVVDDSAVIRGLMTRWLEEDGIARVCASASNGVIALNRLADNNTEVVILDIEMPVMDGLTALPKLIAQQPHLQILMASTLTLRNADISLEALQLGAADYIPKPTGMRFAANDEQFRRALLDKVVALGHRYRQLTATNAPRPATSVHKHSTHNVIALTPQRSLPTAPPQIKLARVSKALPKILAIGSSTGGPQALFNMLAELPKPFPLPILITQHMPPTFTAMLAQHITRLTGHIAVEASHEMLLESGRVHVAPGDYHMAVRIDADRTYRLAISDEAPENFCRPAVDPLFRSVARVFGDYSLCVVLTGMGQDGTKGARDVVGVGGTVLAQDEATSVVWGMPGAVALAGLAARVIPLGDMAGTITNLVQGVKI